MLDPTVTEAVNFDASMIVTIVISVLASPVLVAAINKGAGFLNKNKEDPIISRLVKLEALMEGHITHFNNLEEEKSLSSLDLLTSKILETGFISRTDMRELSIRVERAKAAKIKIPDSLIDKIDRAYLVDNKGEL